MAVPQSPRRYPKGEVRRREILQAALGLIAERGYSASSLQEIADAVGITKAGVLHYFDSREALIAAVLEERDAASLSDYRAQSPDGDTSDMIAMLLHASSRNATTPGLVGLYSRLVVDAAGPAHPAHAYIDERYRRVVGAVADQVRALQADGLAPDLDPDTFAPLVVAISDGLQLQWSYRGDLDMRAALEAAVHALSGGVLPIRSPEAVVSGSAGPASADGTTADDASAGGATAGDASAHSAA